MLVQKIQPPASSLAYRPQKNRRCTSALALLSSISIWSRQPFEPSGRLTLICWSLEKAVHIGDPMSNAGRCSSSSRSVRNHCRGSLKSQGVPSEFVNVRSSASPGKIPSLGCRDVAAVTLGAESISDTTALSRPVASRVNFRPLGPKDDTRAIMSWYLVRASVRSSRWNTAIADRRSRLSCRRTRSRSMSPVAAP